MNRRALAMALAAALVAVAAGRLSAAPGSAAGGWWNAVADSDLEEAAGPWDVFSDFNGGQLIVADAAFAFSGQRFARFGDGITGAGRASLAQVTAPFGHADAVLVFHVHAVSMSGAPNDILRASVDGVEVWSADGTDTPTPDYVEVQVPLRQFADGAAHTLEIAYEAASGAAAAGEFHVDMIQIWTRDAPEADFAWQPQNPAPGEAVQFEDRSMGEPDQWSWDFGDGSGSREQNPVHVYEQPGTYVVTLTVSRSSDGSRSTTQAEILVGDTLAAEFSWDPQQPLPGEAVQFVDQSTGPVTGWHWDFGDGTGDVEQNPVHVYDQPGSYPVELTVTDASGTAASVRHTVVVASPTGGVDFTWQPPDPHAGEGVTFFPTLASDCQVTGWTWSFGDGTGSGDETPVHVYDAPGHYQVTLEVLFDTSVCQESATAVHTVTVQPPELVADFGFQPESPQVGETVEFFDTSRGDPDLWSWDFGDGTGSTLQNPTHAYQAAGTYPVTLTVSRSDAASASSSMTRNITVVESLGIDFTWSPAQPAVWSPVHFAPQLPSGIDAVFWDFGDGDSSSDLAPSHVYLEPGTYLVALWAVAADGSTAYAEHEIRLQPPAEAVELQISNPHPQIGEAVELLLSGAPADLPVAWDLQGPDCEGHPSFFVCNPAEAEECRHIQWRWSEPGVKVAMAWLVISDNPVGPFAARVDVASQGSCATPPSADFEWWPVQPTAGEPVQFADRSAGTPTGWTWSFGDGTGSQEPYPEHVYEEPGTYTVSLTAANDAGSDAAAATIHVAPAASACGDGVCSADESAWSCPEDCGEGADTTGRSGDKGTSLAVPAAASNQPGLNGTLWFTEGTIVNPGTEPARVVAHFRRDGDEGGSSVQAVQLPPRSGLHFDDLVGTLFGETGVGSLRLSCDQPVVLDTRTYNSSSRGTYGQGISGILRRHTLGAGEGPVYLLGMKESTSFRTNLILQETTGQAASVTVTFHDRAGVVRGTAGPIEIAPRSRRFLRLAFLGEGFRGHGYCTLEVGGEGRVAVIGSVVDQRTGDATTVDAIHPQQVLNPQPTQGTEKSSGSLEGEGRYLVAVVARTPGLNGTQWRSELTILNPSTSQAQDVRLIYIEDAGPIHQAEVSLGPGQEFSTDDVVTTLFPDADSGSGSLHVTAQLGVAVSSRTYTVVDEVTGATAGQAIPGLASGDLIRPGEVWVLSNLKSTDDFRCNLGFSEFEGSDTHVTVTLFDTSAGVMRFLASKTYPVPGYRHVQITELFQDMGLEGSYPEVMATVVVADDAGTVYAYASIVDNESGDATTLLPKRQ